MNILQSFLTIDSNNDFPIQNLPYGVFQHSTQKSPRVGVAIGEYILDLSILENKGFFKDLTDGVFASNFLNGFMELGFEIWHGVREVITNLLSSNSLLSENKDLQSECLFLMNECDLFLPVKVSEFTDFYSSYNHAYNVGSLIRGPENALMDNWKHIPIAYHGRSSSVILSGDPIRRPLGQTKSPDKDIPDFGPTKRLDFELEMGFFVGKSNNIGEPIPITETYKYIFGMVLVNDWSGRDIQVWEYRPLGPFLAKNFATSISPWVVPMEALEPFKVQGMKQDPIPLPYLQLSGKNSFDIKLQVALKSEKMPSPKIISNSNTTNLYWNIYQQLAHHSVGGCNMQVGDLLASGTISGTKLDERGCLLEMTLLGKQPVKISDEEERRFLEDGDTVILSGYCQGDGYRVGFGSVETKILPAHDV